MPIIRVGVQAPQGSSGQVVDLDGPRATISSIANVSAESIAYSLDGGSSWTTLLAGASGGGATVNGGMLRLRKVASGGYPATVDVNAETTGLTESVLSNAEQAGVQALVSGAWSPPARMVGFNQEQPAAITRPVRTFGKLACRFGSGQWTATSGTPTLTQGHTGWNGSGVKSGMISLTGMPDMLKAEPSADNGSVTNQISLGTFATNMLTKSLGGKVRLVVYLEAQKGYQAGGAAVGGIGMEVGTNADMSNPLFVSWNSNQLREGWNFLDFVMRDPAAYVDASGVSEHHPFGISAINYGTGANSNIKDNAAAFIRLSWDNLNGSTLYFDSIWCGWDSQCQVVLGCDAGINLETIAAPIFDTYGWAGYLAMPYRIWASGSYQVLDMDASDGTDVAQMLRLYAKGWDMVNHTINHLAASVLTSEAAIAYEVEMARAWQYENDMPRGAEFYASPQSSSSRLSEGVIKASGFKLQRHARKWNVSVTPWGIDNPHHVGSLDISSNLTPAYSTTTAGSHASVSGLQTASKINRCIDIAVAYGATVFPFWHGITAVGDAGTGETLTGDNLLIYQSAFTQAMAYIRAQELAGNLTVCRGVTGFYYGSN